MANKFVRALSSSDDGHHEWRRPIRHKDNAYIVRNGALVSTTLNLKKRTNEENEGPGAHDHQGRKISPLPLWFRVKRQIRGACIQARMLFRSMVIYTMDNRLTVAKNLCVAMAWISTVYSLPIEFAAAFVSVSLIVAICMNLGGKRAKGELSAYSVFNKGFHQLPGTLNASTIDAQLRNQSSEVSSGDVQTNLQRVANEHQLEMQERAKTLGRKVNVQIRHSEDGRVVQMKWRHAQARVDSGLWELYHVPRLRGTGAQPQVFDLSDSDED